MPFCDAEDWGVLSAKRSLDFTTCFQDSLLTVVPSALLLLGTAPRLFKLVQKGPLEGGPLEGVKFSLWFIVKAAFATVALALQIALFAVLVERDYPSSALLSSALYVVSISAALILHYFEHFNMPNSSSILLVYWLFTALISIFPTRTRIEQSPNGLADSLPLLKLLFTIVASIVFGLENITKSGHHSLTRPFVDKVVQAKPSPEPYANLFSRLTFVWVLPLLNKGKMKALRMEDIWSLHPKMLSYPLLLSTQARIDADEAIARQKEQDLAGKKTGTAPGETTDQPQKIRLFSILVHTVGWVYLTAAIPCMLYTIVMYTRPVMLSGLITFMSSYTNGSKEKNIPEQPVWKGYGLVLGVLTTSVLGGIFNSQYQFICFQCSLIARGVFNSLICRKALRLSSTNKQEGMGSIVNHMSVDVDNVLQLFVIFHTLWSSFIGVIVALVLLYQEVQYAMFASLGVTFSIAVVGGFVSSLTGKVYDQMSVKNDHRMKLVNELVNHIKSIKLYAWERFFVRHISEARMKQLNSLRLFNIIVTTQIAIYNIGSPLSAFALLTVYSYIAPPSAPLNLEKIFTCLILLSMLDSPLSYLANSISRITSGHVSYVRLRTFLESEEINPANVERHPNADLSEIAYEVNDGTFGWYSPEAIKKLEEKREEEAKDAMKSKTDQEGETVAVDKMSDVASTGTVSESTVASINEKDAESIDTLGPFLRNVSFTIKRGSLTAIIGRVGEGKSSLVAALLGEMYKYSGSVCSYGSLAYVAQSAWILNGTVRSNIVFGREFDKDWYLQVTNACALAPDFKMLIHGDQTQIGEKGVNLSGGQRQRISIARAIYAKTDVYIFDDPLSAVDAHVDRHIFEEAITKILSGKTRILVTNGAIHLKDVDQIIVVKQGRISQDGTYEDLMQDTQGDLHRMITESKTIVSKEPALSGTQVWLQIWGKENNKINPSHSNQYWILTYLGWILFTSASLILALITFLLILARKASKSLHASIVNPLVRSPMSFFDVTSSGKIINRFAHDFSTIDVQLPFDLVFLSLNLMVNLMQIGFCIAATPYFLILMVPLFGCYYYLSAYYLISSREIKRLDSAARSPMYAHFGETLNGMATIRGFGDTDRFSTQATTLLDQSQQVFYLTSTTQQWLQVMMQLLSGIVTTFVALMAVLQRNSASAGLFAIVLSEISGFTANIQTVMTSVCSLETTIVSVERVKEYSELTPEAPYEIPDSRTDKSWPEHGQIEFQNYSTRYREGLDPVLRNVSLSICAGERIGIVGRTGAGKSSVNMALFRMIEATEGKILIDGVDTSTLGLQELRSRLTIIPQDPFLFGGTIRTNLDPFDQHQDADLWAALEAASLKQYVSSLPNGLQEQVDNGGENMSLGQRQLVNLARAMLNKNTKVLCLDEATAAIDIETDNAIQRALRKSFTGCTVLTIAHRINTILDSDRILVLEHGEVAEFDKPAVLLANKNSIFYSLVNSHDN
ncbi:hypothetical protein BGW38_010571 [Lunasporangiospora selenospora]|uniref:Uncharacterized protein n=1 Tax=Lunasporangiospora selenospora TaxID=979761 RepID=A0A9P6FWK4_9FUNG|nr:hypothetical protein BGW38_010571 [Lunasporangiospora selenospora]